MLSSKVGKLMDVCLADDKAVACWDYSDCDRDYCSSSRDCGDLVDIHLYYWERFN